MIAALIIAVIVLKPVLRDYRRRRVRNIPFGSRWQGELQQAWGLYGRIPAELKTALHAHMQVFLDEKSFVGCNGLQVTPRMKHIIAAQACLLLLKKDISLYDRIACVLIYPTAFINAGHRSLDNGATITGIRVLSGESWQTGKVILSWDDVQAGAQHGYDGQNVVIHEFAHQLDQDNGYANGAPYLTDKAHYEKWSHVLSQQFQQLQQALQLGQPHLLDAYAASNPAEFFAVASEVFFEQAELMRSHMP